MIYLFDPEYYGLHHVLIFFAGLDLEIDKGGDELIMWSLKVSMSYNK